MKKTSCATVATLVLAGLFIAGAATAQQTGLPVIPLNAGLHVIQAEVANTNVTRAIGLMHRKAMDANHGMLFDFDVAAPHCMWMRNTLIPLSVAFMDQSGKILNIADMIPHDETSHCATGAARFALEMNRGWFAGKGIKPGAKIGGLEKIPSPR